MALLGKPFDATAAEPRQERDFKPMPPGKYLIHIMNSEQRSIKPKDGQDPNGDYGSYLWLEMEVINGEFERRRMFENLVLNHPNPQTVQIAESTLAQICFACGKPKIEDSEELHGIPMIADIVVEQDRRTKHLPVGHPEKLPAVNRVKAYQPADNAVASSYAAPQSAAGNGAMASAAGSYTPPAGGGVANGGVAGGSIPQAPASGNKLPWGR